MKEEKEGKNRKSRAELFGPALAAAVAAAWIAGSGYIERAYQLEGFECRAHGREASLAMMTEGRSKAPEAAGREMNVRCPENVEFIAGRKMNANAATREELALLPDIGLKTAQAILLKRDELNGFADMDELLETPGISDPARASLDRWVLVK